jgi:SAM-dependent methyltransferase
VFDYDAEVRRHNEQFRAATGVCPDDSVLDIGCGAGQSTREAARAAVAGSVLGVDISTRMLERARRITHDEKLRNVTFQQADAEVHTFPAEHFDRCISRFGTMFFTDPIAAFTNIAGALRPGAGLALMVWQDRDRNEWSTAIRGALAGAKAAGPPAGKDPFSLADPARTQAILTAAGFMDVHFADVHEPVYYGADVATAYDAVFSLLEPKALIAEMSGPAAERARDSLRATLAAHDTGSGVFFDSRAWIITARRR